MTTSTSLAPSTPPGVREEIKPSLHPVWLVFARRKYAEPLAEIGTVRAETPEMAAMFARSIYDEHPWIEMLVAPRAAMKTAIAP
jgi:1,2-phenylacetyl-CoA epoxidase PaaB subunit